jgi:hypothetical protein
VHLGGVEEVVTDKGYHSNEVAVRLGELEVRTYIAEPHRGARHWEGKPAEKEAVYGNRRRIGENGVSGCNDSAGRRSNATSRISSIPGVWIGYTSGGLGTSTRNC